MVFPQFGHVLLSVSGTCFGATSRVTGAEGEAGTGLITGSGFVAGA